MSKETKKVLEMLAAGQITAEDAEKLLDKLGADGAAPASPAAPEPAVGAEGKSAPQRVGWRVSARDESAEATPKLRFLRIVVDKPDEDQVNIRVPLAFIRAGMKLLGVIPPQVSERLAEKGIDLAALRDLKGGELVDELKDLHVDVDSKNGETVRIYCE
ncbi:MAG TPA: hypothetical protein VMO17_20750 [Terriglobia bacterium]|nr:hypothetical protein [Terriglobia bacterium]